ncbi:DUF3307 domain-containing protein [Pseudoalteromonas sp. Hal040]|uniref:DUF3307 domain-containing protein n=1 Tax=unclassified Pseudoalteromonas TaxID=194690 RepID=UPI00301E1A5D
MTSFALLLTALVLGHLLADFYWQPMSWVQDRNNRHFRASKLYLHVLTHGVTSLAVLTLWEYTYGWQELSRVLLATVGIMLSHYVIDLAKSYSSKGVVPFLLDQLAHLVVIIMLSVWLSDKNEFYSLAWQKLIALDTLFVIAAYILVLNPSSVFIRMMLEKINIQINNEGSIPAAGHFIGLLERVLMLSFILLGEYGGVGFLLAAKSIFRFGDLKESSEKQLTEYVMLGTLLSVTVTLFIGVATLYCIKLV